MTYQLGGCSQGHLSESPHDSSGGPGEVQGALMIVRVMWSLCHDDGSSLVMTL